MERKWPKRTNRLQWPSLGTAWGDHHWAMRLGWTSLGTDFANICTNKLRNLRIRVGYLVPLCLVPLSWQGRVQYHYRDSNFTITIIAISILSLSTSINVVINPLHSKSKLRAVLLVAKSKWLFTWESGAPLIHACYRAFSCSKRRSRSGRSLKWWSKKQCGSLLCVFKIYENAHWWRWREWWVVTYMHSNSLEFM